MTIKLYKAVLLSLPKHTSPIFDLFAFVGSPRAQRFHSNNRVIRFKQQTVSSLKVRRASRSEAQ